MHWWVFLGRGGEVMSLEKGLCVVGTPDLPLSELFLTLEKGQCDRTAICNADHVQEEGKKEKEARNQWSCINLLTANVLDILILDPFPRQTAIVPLGPTFFSPSIPFFCAVKDATLSEENPQLWGLFEAGRSNCH